MTLLHAELNRCRRVNRYLALLALMVLGFAAGRFAVSLIGAAQTVAHTLQELAQ